MKKIVGDRKQKLLIMIYLATDERIRDHSKRISRNKFLEKLASTFF
jgi:hypothetical protein